MKTLSLYDYQEADVQAFLRHNATGVLAAETGAGKTVIAAATAIRSGARTTLIVAPQGTHRKVWDFTFRGGERDGEFVEGLAPDARVRQINSKPEGKAAMADLEWGEPGVYLMTPQLFTLWKPEHLRPDLMMVDEAHLLGNRESAGGKLLMKFSGYAGSRITMSGTLYRNRFENGWTFMRFLWPERSDMRDISDISVNRWIDTYCATEYDHWAPGNRKVVGELNPGALADLAPCWRQHFKRAECCEFHPEGFLHDVPEPIVIRETVELTVGQRTAIKQMQQDYLSYLDLATEEWLRLPPLERKKKALVTKMPIVRETRLSQMTLAMPSLIPRPAKEGADCKMVDVDGRPFRQAVDDRGIPLWDVVFAPDAESPKLDKLIEIWRNVNEPIVAATNSQKYAELVVNRLNAKKIRAFEWSGSYSQAERDAALERFEAGQIDIMVGVTSAIGTGIDGLQHVSGVLVSLNKDRDMANEVQLEGRLDRRGQKRLEGVVHYEIIAEGSQDEGIIDEQLARRLKLNRSLRREVTRQ